MAKTYKAPYTQSFKVDTAVATAALASTTGDAPTGTVLLSTAGADGAIITKVAALPRATVTATRCDLFVSGDGGTTKRLIATALMAAHTVAATTAIPETDFGFTPAEPLVLGPNEELYVGIAVALASGVVFHARREDY